MSDVVVKAEGVGKRYRVKAPGEGGYVALRDVLAQGVHGLRDVLRGRARTPDEAEAFWALRAVDFEIRRGEVVGLIGRNGAGKSTLLKLLSRITEPTEGRITIRGRVASLLEVGTGFHPELTGRENIFLNGAILGMSRAEIRQQFDAIVAFAEVERFLDTPVKRFSSGMYVRLAFAVAAHLRAEILIVDEVLAVGDAEFQARCLGKMGEVAGDGRTVLFVSHNLAAVERLCGSALLLEAGRILEHGPVAPLVQRYLDRTTSNNVHTDARRVRNAGEIIQVTGVDLLVDHRPTRHVKSGDCCAFAIKYTCKSPEILRQSPDFVIEIYLNGQKVTALWSGSFSNFEAQLDTGTVHCVVPRWPLREGAVRINLAVHIGSLLQDWIEDILLFNSHDGPFFGTGPITDSSQGIAFVEHSWLTNQNITSNDLTKIDTT